MGYHIRNIPRGTFGEWSKVSEEVEEIIDALEQNLKPMLLIELCDCLGAIRAVYTKNGDFDFENSLYEFSTERNLYYRYTNLDIIIEKFKLDIKEADMEENPRKLAFILVSFVVHYFAGSVTVVDLVKFYNKTMQVWKEVEECVN